MTAKEKAFGELKDTHIHEKSEYESFSEGWNAAIRWAAENAETRTIPASQENYRYDVIDKQSILKGLNE